MKQLSINFLQILSNKESQASTTNYFWPLYHLKLNIFHTWQCTAVPCNAGIFCIFDLFHHNLYVRMNKKNTLLILAAITFVIIVCNSSCALDRRRYSTFRDENGDVKTEHYNQYKRKWYRKNWYNRQIWR